MAGLDTLTVVIIALVAVGIAAIVGLLIYQQASEGELGREVPSEGPSTSGKARSSTTRTIRPARVRTIRLPIIGACTPRKFRRVTSFTTSSTAAL